MPARALPGLDCAMNRDEQLRAYLEAVDRLPPLGEHEVCELGETIRRGNQAGNLLEGGSLASQQATAAKRPASGSSRATYGWW
jgi:hypothetical protein